MASKQHSRACGFCKSNKEAENIYTNHQLKDALGNVTCPQLFKHRCELCGATGREAHTRSYCPTVVSMRQQQQQQQLQLQLQLEQQNCARDLQKGPFASGGRAEAPRPDSSSHSIRIAADRKFLNMRKLTSSRYNSAGKLRNQVNCWQDKQHKTSGPH